MLFFLELHISRWWIFWQLHRQLGRNNWIRSQQNAHSSVWLQPSGPRRAILSVTNSASREGFKVLVWQSLQMDCMETCKTWTEISRETWRESSYSRYSIVPNTGILKCILYEFFFIQVIHFFNYNFQHRFNREFELGERSCLRKIYEGDDSPSKCMILVVANIWKIPYKQRVNTIFVVELTDGWYSMGWKIAQADDPFRWFLYKHKFIRFLWLKLNDFEHFQKTHWKWQDCGRNKAYHFWVRVEKFRKTMLTTWSAKCLWRSGTCFLRLKGYWKRGFQVCLFELECKFNKKIEMVNFYCCLSISFLIIIQQINERYSKLGFNHRILSLPTKFCSILKNGGFVSEVEVYIVRKYPIIYAR